MKVKLNFFKTCIILILIAPSIYAGNFGYSEIKFQKGKVGLQQDTMNIILS